MSVLLMYVSVGIWLVALAVSAFATYRLCEYGPYNANLVWDFIRNVTELTTCIALGIVGSLLACRDSYWGYDYLYIIIPMFACGYLLARIILILVLRLVTNPYLKKEQREKQYTQAMLKAEWKLRKEGLYPSLNLFSGDPQAENERFSRALDELRAQGKLPPVPEWMLKNN